MVIFLIMPQYVKAYVTGVNDSNKFIYLDEVNDNSYIMMCSYVQTETLQKAGNQGTYNEYERINIYYLYNNNWKVVWDKASGITTLNSLVEKSGFYQDVFSNDSKVHISEEDVNSLALKGKCPTSAYVDTGGGYSELCLGSESYCKSKTNFGTSFASSKVSTSKNYDINDHIVKYFEKWSPSINSCTELRNKNTSIKETLEQDFLNNFLHGKSVPDFIQNNENYINGMTKFTKKLTKIKEDCDKEVENDTSLTEEEKKELKKKNQEGLDSVVNDVEDFKDNVKNNTESESKSDSDDDDKSDFSGYDVNDTSIGEICSMPQYRKTMRFFGTIVTFAKYIVPLIIIAFGIMDLYKAVTGAKDDDIKKSFKAIMVRIAAGVLIFLLPGLVQFFFNMLNEWSNYKVDVCCCTECLLNSSCDTNSCNSGSCKIEGMNN